MVFILTSVFSRKGRQRSKENAKAGVTCDISITHRDGFPDESQRVYQHGDRDASVRLVPHDIIHQLHVEETLFLRLPRALYC